MSTTAGVENNPESYIGESKERYINDLRAQAEQLRAQAALLAEKEAAYVASRKENATRSEQLGEMDKTDATLAELVKLDGEFAGLEILISDLQRQQKEKTELADQLSDRAFQVENPEGYEAAKKLKAESANKSSGSSFGVTLFLAGTIFTLGVLASPLVKEWGQRTFNLNPSPEATPASFSDRILSTSQDMKIQTVAEEMALALLKRAQQDYEENRYSSRMTPRHKVTIRVEESTLGDTPWTEKLRAGVANDAGMVEEAKDERNQMELRLLRERQEQKAGPDSLKK